MAALRGDGIGAVALVATLLVGTAARGVDASAADQARARVAEGADQFEHHHYREAREAFEAAHLLWPSNGRIYFDLAKAQVEMEQKDEAAESFEMFLEMTAHDPDLDPANVRDAKQQIAKARASLAVVRIEVPGGKVPPGFRVRVEDASQSRITSSHVVYLPIDPRSHTLKVLADGMQPIPLSITTPRSGVLGPQKISFLPTTEPQRPPPTPERAPWRRNNGACDQIMTACRRAGFRSPTALLGDCFRALVIEHREVVGVQLPPDVIDACADKQAPP